MVGPSVRVCVRVGIQVDGARNRCPVAEQLRIDAIAQAMQHQQVDFVDAGGTLVRHADLDIGFAQRAPDRPAGAAAALAALPSKATTVMSRACAASTAASTAADWPLALRASSTSPA